jgi:signal transduction histidine kinase
VADHHGRSVTSFSATASGEPDLDLWERFRQVWPVGRPFGDDAVSRWILAERTPLVLDDYAESPFCDPVVLAAFGARSLIALPLLHGDRVVGVMTIDRTEVRAFSAPEVRLAVSLAETIAPLVERARVRDETEAELRQAEAQVEIARSLSSTLELKPLLKVIAQQAARACGMDRCSVFLYRDGRLVPVMSQYADGHTDADLWEMFKTQVSGWVDVPVVDEAAETRAPVIVNDTQNDPRVPPAVRQFRGRRMLALPLMRPDKMVGVLGLEYVDRDRPILAAQVNLGMTIGTQIALALENARLLGEAQAAAEALRAKNAELDSFVYTVSHDLKSPLVTIQGMAALVLEEHGATLDDTTRRYVERIELNTRHMEHLLVDLLALSRIGRETREPEEIDLAGLVAGVLAELDEPLRARDIAVTVGPLPRLTAVRVELEQVMRSLLTNAVKYIGAGPSPAIEVGAVDRGAVVECWVRDSGIGIDPAYQDKIFDLFQRLREVQAEGTGIGLAIARKIVDAAGGRIWVESAPGAGSTFRFTWPKAGRDGGLARVSRGAPGPSSPPR